MCSCSSEVQKKRFSIPGKSGKFCAMLHAYLLGQNYTLSIQLYPYDYPKYLSSTQVQQFMVKGLVIRLG